MIAALLGGGVAVVLGLCVAAGLRADRARKRGNDGKRVFWFDAGDGGSDCGDGGGCGGDGGGGD